MSVSSGSNQSELAGQAVVGPCQRDTASVVDSPFLESLPLILSYTPSLVRLYVICRNTLAVRPVYSPRTPGVSSLPSATVHIPVSQSHSSETSLRFSDSVGN